MCQKLSSFTLLETFISQVRLKSTFCVQLIGKSHVAACHEPNVSFEFVSISTTSSDHQPVVISSRNKEAQIECDKYDYNLSKNVYIRYIFRQLWMSDAFSVSRKYISFSITRSK